ncbi:BAG family molecular chaperone regulator 8, chloroplastic [Pyrus communis]|uniref:BAG family molecular chaperone regulator 8, chloroplastic n=1 Tax=Pyrus communis TaxID=23211 RepID=UPI0035C0DEF0
MASHHHLHHAHHHQPQTPTAAICCTSSYNTCCCTQTHNPYPPPPPATDPLLQALASQLLQSTPPDPYSPHHNLRPKNPHHTHNAHHPKHRSRQQPPQDQLISSLLSRIEALESSLHHYSSASHCSHSSYSRSLRDSAARVIQTHFRAFLVRRSRTLRQLKDLAFIKSAFTSLKSSISSETHLDFHAISQKSINLLLKLDTIQGGDPIVRDGKRSISRDLVRFLEFIDGVVMKRHGLSLKAVKNVRSGQNVNKPRVLPAKCGRDVGWDQREKIENLRDRIEKIRGFARIAENDEEDVELEGFQHDSDEDEENLRLRFKNGVLVKRRGLQPKVKKNVSFAENGNVYRVFSNSDEPVSGWDGSDSSDDHGELVENPCGEVEEVKGIAQETEEDDEEAHTENGESPQASSDGEINPGARMTPRREDMYETRGRDQGQNEYLLFSAPLPVKMESKADTIKRNNAVKL